MNPNDDVLQIRVSLDTGSLTGEVKQTEAAINATTKATRSFFDLERGQMNQLRDAWKERKQQIKDYSKELEVSQTSLKQIISLYNQQERAADRAAAAQERAAQRAIRVQQQQERAAAQAARASNQAGRNPITALYNSGSLGGAVGGAVLGQIGGFGLLPQLGGAVAGGLGLSVPAIGAVVGGLAIINTLVDKGVDLVKSWVQVWYEYRSTIERAKLGLGVLLGSQQDATKYVNDLIVALHGLGDIDSAITLSKRLLTIGASADVAKQKVTELATIAVGAGLDTSAQKGLAKALSDVVTAGRLKGQEVNQFANAGINIQSILAQNLGVTPRQIIDLQKKGQIGASQVLAAITQEAEKYKPAFENALLLPETSFTRIKQQLGRLGDVAFGGFFDQFSVRLKSLADELEQAQTLSEMTDALSDAFFEIGGTLAGKLISGIVTALLSPGTYIGILKAVRSGFANAGAGVVESISEGISPGSTKTEDYKETIRMAREIASGSLDGENAIRPPAAPSVVPYKTSAELLSLLRTGKEIGGITDNTGEDRKKHKRTFGERLADRVANLRKEIGAFSNLNSPYFRNKFTAEGLERQKRDYESILNTRYDMGLPLDTPLPADAKDAKALREEMDSAKRVFEGIKTIQEEARKASEDLAIAIATHALPVIGSEIRFQTAYNKLIRERRNEEQQLTADVKLEAQKRIDAMTDEEQAARETNAARLTLFRDVLKEGNDARQDALKASLRRQLYEGAQDTDILDSINSMSPELTPIQNIDKNVAGIFAILSGSRVAGEGGAAQPYLGPYAPTSGGSAGGSDTITIGTQAIFYNDARRKAIKQRVDADLDNAIPDLIDQVDKLRYTEERYGDAAYSAKVRDLELTKQQIEQQRDLRVRVEDAGKERAKLLQELIDLEDAGSKRSQVTRTEADNAILKSQIATKENIVKLQEEIGNASVGSADRYREAWLEATLDVSKRNEEAIKSQIKSQVELEQKTVFSAEQARAKILEGMAQAKGYTDIFAEGFLKVTDGIGTGVERVLNSATQHLGVVGQFISSIGADLLRLVSNRLLVQLLDFFMGGALTGTRSGGVSGAGAGGYGGATGATGVGGLGGIVTGIAGGFLTPGFNGGYPNIGTGSSGGGTIGLPYLGQLPVPLLQSAINGKVEIPGAGAGALSLSGIGKQIGALAPFLGFGAGAALGGKSTLGGLLGGIGGALGGLVGAASVGAIGGTLGSAFALSGALGPAALIAAPLLIVGGLLLGKAKQRREDERTADTYWVAYKDTLIDLTRQVRSNSIDGDDALAQAQAARQQAISQINTIQTKSVRESRLKNQIGDVDRMFLEPLKQAVNDQKSRNSLSSKLIPEFAASGIVPGPLGSPQLVLAHGGEIFINRDKQTTQVMSAASDAGVPGVSAMRGSAAQGRGDAPIHVTLVVGKKMQNEMFKNGAKSQEGYTALVDAGKKQARFRDIDF